ncbi:methyltransferase domain-containing protein [Paenibacillus sp. N4]|uniref:class I SAM-dependent DNA methyltransferase n=1 Tax=Paenibacillus vietnamensis TaxID=2590547 RepID=UPI001CD07E9C|nr:class I SAM-dependent methyltransferase [Paenibacillus vietnamensis]MCA0756564.1 methyltransferase domain-containing protein [Paenibacillus vietnamensis]
MGREFIELFDHWADHYDVTVLGHDEEYREVFENYDAILEEVAELASGTVLEFGPGTGNLTEKLLRRGGSVYAVEPSPGMRAQFARRSLQAQLLEGDFLQFPDIPEQVDSIVSTYAFHHLTDEEKEQAVAHYAAMLGVGGQIVFADGTFRDEEAKRQLEEAARHAGHLNLVNDMRSEYFTTTGVLERICTNHGFHVTFKQLNRYVWLMHAVKKTD